MLCLTLQSDRGLDFSYSTSLNTRVDLETIQTSVRGGSYIDGARPPKLVK